MVKLPFFLFGAALLCLILFGVALPLDSRAQESSATKDDAIKRGAQVYKTRCALCHLPEGKSPNKRMRFSDHEWKHGDKPDQVEKIVADGVKGTAMMGFKNKLKSDDIKAVTAYIMDLSAKAKE